MSLTHPLDMSATQGAREPDANYAATVQGLNMVYFRRNLPPRRNCQYLQHGKAADDKGVRGGLSLAPSSILQKLRVANTVAFESVR
jgi:hypothetical protein